MQQSTHLTSATSIVLI